MQLASLVLQDFSAYVWLIRHEAGRSFVREPDCAADPAATDSSALFPCLRRGVMGTWDDAPVALAHGKRTGGSRGENAAQMRYSAGR